MARSFSGTTDKIAVSPVTQLSSTTVGTYGGWFWSNGKPASNLWTIIQCVSSAPRGGTGIFEKTDGNLIFAAWDPVIGQQIDIQSTGVDISSGWSHVACIYDTALNAVNTLVVNGIIPTGGTGNSANAWSINANQTLGFAIGDWSGFPGPFNGKMQDCFWYSAQLTVDECNALYLGARPPSVRQQSLIGYWPFDGLASPEPDLSGSQLNGTLTGTSAASGPPITMFTPRWPMGGIFPIFTPTGFPYSYGTIF